MLNRKRLYTGFTLAVGVIAAIIIFSFYSSIYPSTDDAYVQANIVNVTTQVSGPINQIFVEDHQQVKAGQLLFTIDPQPFQIAVQQAQANLAQTQAQLSTQQKDTARILPLVANGQLPQADGDDAQGKVEELTAGVKAAQAALAQAQLNLTYTQITAPANGYVTNFVLRVGQYVQESNPLFALVETDQWWVDANFKETDLERIRIGQPAEIVLDIYPGIKFKGKVQGISAGSGAAFSILPPENATGNWVKVTQRFPVRVNIINPNPTYPLRVGASSTVTINTH